MLTYGHWKLVFFCKTMSDSCAREYICDFLMKSLVIGHQQKQDRFWRNTKKPLTSWYVFMVFFQITGSHDYEDSNAKGLVSAPVIRIERRKTKGKYIAWTMETSVRVQLMYYRRSLWRYWMNPETISPHVATISPYVSNHIVRRCVAS